MTYLVHLYSYLGGNNRLKDFYRLYRYRVNNKFGAIRRNQEKYGRNGKLGGHWERAVKNGLAVYVTNKEPLPFTRAFTILVWVLPLYNLTHSMFKNVHNVGKQIVCVVVGLSRTAHCKIRFSQLLRKKLDPVHGLNKYCTDLGLACLQD